jgi:hypothetical protein
MTELEHLDRCDDQETILRGAYFIEGVAERGTIHGIDPAYVRALAKKLRTVGYRQMRDQIDAEKVA